MEKTEIIKEMKAALVRYDTIKEEEFDFLKIVSVYDKSKKCGTVCCLWGWEPKFKVLDVKWIRYDTGMVLTDVYPSNILNWGHIVSYLYYGSSLSSVSDRLDEDASLKEVLMYWEVVIQTLENTTAYDDLLNITYEIHD